MNIKYAEQLIQSLNNNIRAALNNPDIFLISSEKIAIKDLEVLVEAFNCLKGGEIKKDEKKDIENSKKL